MFISVFSVNINCLFYSILRCFNIIKDFDMARQQCILMQRGFSKLHVFNLKCEYDYTIQYTTPTTHSYGETEHSTARTKSVSLIGKNDWDPSNAIFVSTRAS